MSRGSRAFHSSILTLMGAVACIDVVSAGSPPPPLPPPARVVAPAPIPPRVYSTPPSVRNVVPAPAPPKVAGSQPRATVAPPTSQPAQRSPMTALRSNTALTSDPNGPSKPRSSSPTEKAYNTPSFVSGGASGPSATPQQPAGQAERQNPIVFGRQPTCQYGPGCAMAFKPMMNSAPKPITSSGPQARILDSTPPQSAPLQDSIGFKSIPVEPQNKATQPVQSRMLPSATSSSAGSVIKEELGSGFTSLPSSRTKDTWSGTTTDTNVAQTSPASRNTSDSTRVERRDPEKTSTTGTIQNTGMTNDSDIDRRKRNKASQ